MGKFQDDIYFNYIHLSKYLPILVVHGMAYGKYNDSIPR